MSLPVAVFASGSGTNLQSLLDREREVSSGEDARLAGEGSDDGPPESRSGHGVGGVGGVPYRVRLVVSDRPDAGALERAEKAGRRWEVIPVTGRGAQEVADETLALLEEEEIRAVFLAGYLRLVPSAVVRAFRRRILNIHPALLPSFGGKGMYGIRIHREVLRTGARVTGVTVHYVDEEYDTGTILAQWPVPVRVDDTPEDLAARVLRVEHVLYPAAAAHLCRAIARGEEPGPFDPPGELFSVPEEDPMDETADAIHRSFQSRK